TLTAALAACLAALAGVPAHVVTVNDYLAQRDAEKMLPLFAFFGLSVGVVHGGVAQNDRAHQYAQDLTYCTNKDLVFDYLRDRVNAGGINSPAQLAVRRLHQPQRGEERLRLRGLHFAIVDEADSILIDEARTPLILSALSDRGADRDVFAQVLNVAEQLQQDLHFRLIGAQRIPELSKEGRLYLAQLAEDYLAESGSRRKVLDEFWQLDWVREHYVLQALRAIYVYRRDQHYVVLDGKIVIVDEFTGRLLPDRSWEQGLHQLVEVKEGCAATGQNRTLARLTYQVFFGRYLRLAGMSGTLREVAAEMAAVYRVPTLRVEPNRPCQRIERPSLLLRDAEAKHAAIVDEVRQILTQGRAVLIGTRSVMASLAISRALAGAGIVHKVLNALQDEDEASLVAQAGQPGAVTVATNMAGRGTDIPLAPAVAERGGLHVVLSEWHESARIDRQLFGRCARQGDPGSCRAIVALDDELLQHYASAL
ncbi:preprotein translocase subunit SecA, partial [Methylomonas koyamae]